MPDQTRSSNPESPVQPGEVLASKYRVERVLGVGGMGVVLAAWHLELEQRVAIKLMLRAMAAQPEAVERFIREGRASVKLRSEHVARVYDVGRLQTGEPFIVMEFLEGEDLASLVRARGPLPIAQAVDLLAEACEAISEAHDQGITHRDLKPANLFLSRGAHGTPSVKVLDFGISKMRRPGDTSSVSGLTGISTVMGTPSYMAPEQLRASKLADARSDVWALGAVLFELLTGKMAYAGEAITEVVVAVMTEPAPEARQFRADIPEELACVIERCLAKRPEERYQTVPEFVAAIARFGSSRARQSWARLGGPSMSTPPAPSSLRRQLPSPSVEASSKSDQVDLPVAQKPRLPQLLIGIGAACAVAILCGGGWWALHTGSPAAQSAVPLVVNVAPVETPSAMEPLPPPIDASSAGPPALETAQGLDQGVAGRVPTGRNERRDAAAGSARLVPSSTPPKAEPSAPLPTPTTKSGIKDYGGRE